MNLEDSFKGKKVLVAGGTGFVGSNMIEVLLGFGAHVRATQYGDKRPQINNDRIEYVSVDLLQKEDCARAVAGMDYVIMAAANTSGAAVIEKTPLVHVTPNVIMNARMLEAAYEAGVKKFLWFSSNTVYPSADYPVKEEDIWSGPPFEKYFSVAWMKRFGEIMCEIYATKIKNPMQVVVIRPANIYGEYDDFEWETSHVVPALIRKIVERHDPIEVWGDGTEIKDLIYVKDFVEGSLTALATLESFDPINIGTGVPISIKDVLAAIIAADGYDNARIVFNASKPTMIPKRLIDVSKAKRLLGFTATTTLTEGIARTVAWYRDNRV